MKRRITDIQLQQKDPSRRSIFLDGRFFCGASAEVVSKLHLTPQMEIDENELKKLIHEEEISGGSKYAYRILARRMYTSKEIRRKLGKRGYADEAIQGVIMALERLGLLNDAAYAEEWIRWRMRAKPKGKSVLRQELARKGVERPIVEDALSQTLGESEEKNMALDLARKRAPSYGSDDPIAARRKLRSFLIRRGFDFETVRDVVEQTLDDPWSTTRN